MVAASSQMDQLKTICKHSAFINIFPNMLLDFYTQPRTPTHIECIMYNALEKYECISVYLHFQCLCVYLFEICAISVWWFMSLYKCVNSCANTNKWLWCVGICVQIVFTFLFTNTSCLLDNCVNACLTMY